MSIHNLQYQTSLSFNKEVTRMGYGYSYGGGSGFALLVVLFILLIIIGAHYVGGHDKY